MEISNEEKLRHSLEEGENETQLLIHQANNSNAYTTMSTLEANSLHTRDYKDSEPNSL